MRDIDQTMMTSAVSGLIFPALLVMLTFKSATRYIWSGVGDLVYGGNTYQGVGTLGEIGQVIEVMEVQADGTTVSLSGIDPTLLAECLTDIAIGAPANIMLALLTETGQIIGTPYLMFAGQVDQPVFSTGVDDSKISLHLESRMSDLNRASQRKYTMEDQRRDYPDDTGFYWAPIITDKTDVWG